MIHARIADRRASLRVPSSYPVSLRDTRGKAIGRGKTANISERGLFVLLPSGRTPNPEQRVEVEMELPHSPAHQRLTRVVRYTARVVRVERMGQWQGVALELLEKLA